PITLRERTIIPRTIPKFLTIRYPGNSSAEVTIPKSTRGILFSLERAFTAAILTVRTALCEQCSSAILGEHGECILFPGAFSDRYWRVPCLACLAVARLRAAAPAHGPGILHAARGRALPL